MDFGIDTLDSGGTADAPARSSTIILSVAALPAPRPAAHSSTCAALDGSVGSAGADPHCCLYGPVCVGTTHSNASDSLLKSTGRPSERLDRHRGQRARDRVFASRRKFTLVPPTLKAYLGPPINPPGPCTVRLAPLVAVSILLQRGKSGTTSALRRLRQSRHDPQPLRRLTLNSHHRLFIQRPRCLTSMPGPALTGRHTRYGSGVHTQRHHERSCGPDSRPLPSCHIMAPAP